MSRSYSFGYKRKASRRKSTKKRSPSRKKSILIAGKRPPKKLVDKAKNYKVRITEGPKGLKKYKSQTKLMQQIRNKGGMKKTSTPRRRRKSPSKKRSPSKSSSRKRGTKSRRKRSTRRKSSFGLGNMFAKLGSIMSPYPSAVNAGPPYMGFGKRRSRNRRRK